ncbi:hypothetical protein BC832DRAFT_556575 [Gaertneriomyces semiglobifer]|nr:hypothetical protein BC832DRAFT_556575 [Gaertneriomyces semiglobifer]
MEGQQKCTCTENTPSYACPCTRSGKDCECKSKHASAGSSSATTMQKVGVCVHDEACDCFGSGKGCECKEHCTCGQT